MEIVGVVSSVLLIFGLLAFAFVADNSDEVLALFRKRIERPERDFLMLREKVLDLEDELRKVRDRADFLERMLGDGT